MEGVANANVVGNGADVVGNGVNSLPSKQKKCTLHKKQNYCRICLNPGDLYLCDCKHYVCYQCDHKCGSMSQLFFAKNAQTTNTNVNTQKGYGKLENDKGIWKAVNHTENSRQNAQKISQILEKISDPYERHFLESLPLNHWLGNISESPSNSASCSIAVIRYLYQQKKFAFQSTNANWYVRLSANIARVFVVDFKVKIHCPDCNKSRIGVMCRRFKLDGTGAVYDQKGSQYVKRCDRFTEYFANKMWEK